MYETIYIFFKSALWGMFYYLYSYRFSGVKIKKINNYAGIAILSALCAAYALTLGRVLPEPFRSVLFMAAFSVYLKFSLKIKITISFFTVFISGLLYLGALGCAGVIAFFANYFFIGIPDQNYHVGDLLSLPISFGLNALLYFTVLNRDFSFIFKKGQGPVAGALVTLFFSYCSLHFLFSGETLYLIIFTWAVFLAGAAFIILYMRSELKKDGEKIALERAKAELSEKNDVLRADNHKYADMLPAIEKRVDDALREIKSDEVCDALRNGLALNQIPILIENRRSAQNESAFIPKTGSLALDAYFEELKTKCGAENINFRVIANPRLSVPGGGRDLLAFSRLVINNVSNAFRELVKTDVSEKKILAVFKKDGDDNYRVEIYDNAHEFDINTIANLGRRGNSTNGSGYGWENTFELLSRFKASAEIKEFQPFGSEFTKRIAITFDGKTEFKINSYRKNQILEAASKNQQNEILNAGNVSRRA